jgi:DNA-binding transcriptional regulator GbsR (MarR family)
LNAGTTLPSNHRRSDPHDPGQAELAVADTVGRLMHFWGFKRPMGRIWTVLYLSPVPLSAAELGERLKMSAGGVSMALNELEQWGAVLRTWQPGHRRDYFRAEANIWKMVRRVLRDRELLLVREFRAVLQNAEAELEGAGEQAAVVPPSEAVSGESSDPAAELSYKRERLRRLAELAATGESLLAALVAGQAIDPSTINDEPGP